MKELTLTAYPVKQGNTVFYLTAIAAGNLTDEDYWRIDRWNATTNEGYQREINQSHAHRLARYFSKSYLKGEDDATTHRAESATSKTPVNGNNMLPSAVVINFRNPLEITPLAGGAVKIRLEKWPGYIIDGQHRIEGVREAIFDGAEIEDYEFPVTLTNLSLEEEMVQFRNLNTTANRPPKGLNEAISHSLYTKYGRTPSTWSEIANSRATGVVLRLATDITSPWYGKIALGGVRKRAMHTTVQAQFTQSLSTMFNSGRFSDPEEKLENMYTLISNYWLAIQKVWPDAVNNMESSMIMRQTGYHPLNRLLERIFNNIKINPSYEDFVEILESIKVNAQIGDVSWTRGVGQLDQLQKGYSYHKGFTIATDYLWGSVDDVTKSKLRSV